ncbi:MAG: TolC family protein, partial [Thermoguttaceae bacterium]
SQPQGHMYMIGYGSIFTANDGKCLVSLTPYGNLIQVVTKDRKFGKAVQVVGEDYANPITLVLEPVETARIQFINEATGGPLAGVQVRCSLVMQSPTTNSTICTEIVVTDSNGVAEFPCLYSGGTYRFAYCFDNSPPIDLTITPTKPGEVVDYGVIMFPKGYELPASVYTQRPTNPIPEEKKFTDFSSTEHNDIEREYADASLKLAEREFARINDIEEKAPGSLPAQNLINAKIDLLEAQALRHRFHGKLEEAIKALNETIPLYEEIVKQAQSMYNSGIIPEMELNEEELKLLNARVNITRVELEQNNTQKAIEKYTQVGIERIKKEIQIAEDKLKILTARKEIVGDSITNVDIADANISVLISKIRLCQLNDDTETAKNLWDSKIKWFQAKFNAIENGYKHGIYSRLELNKAGLTLASAKYNKYAVFNETESDEFKEAKEEMLKWLRERVEILEIMKKASSEFESEYKAAVKALEIY